jgi:3-deoxy-D-manno-octulosonic-acid transferase
MYYLYNFLATVLFIFVILPYFTVRYFREKGFPRRFRQSMGFIRDDEIAAVAHKKLHLDPRCLRGGNRGHQSPGQ